MGVPGNEQLRQQLEALFPGFQIVLGGENAGEEEVSPALQEKITAFNDQLDARFLDGQCCDCGVQMDNWAQIEEETWELPPGWTWYADGDDNPVAWQCPICDAEAREKAALAGGLELKCLNSVEDLETN